MSLPTAPSVEANDPAADDVKLARVLETCLADLEAGRTVDPERLLADHPAIAGRLRACLASLDLVRQGAGAFPALPGEAAHPPVGTLGDFRILREVGRGGMGVVYEAEQISLGRRVALKVLPFAATLDPRHLQRFKNEAQAAASLHHTHIVPVHGVGCERGVHYYAMQFIDGQTLAELIAGFRKGAVPEGMGAAAPAAAPTRPVAALSTERSARSPGYFRAVARLGVQAATALEHAHQLGVVHRDVKPANLLVDAAGHLWVTDFGLARCRTGAGPTATGDVVGTLRYMSPEQALAKRDLVDHRSDIYSLGVTLYEALTLEPAYPGTDREELLRQIAEGEPRPPRRLNPALPAELETVILKAMARDPDGRYASAQELADDLNRFLEHRPVQAMRPTLRERLAKWAWRHKPVVAAAVTALVLAVAGLSAATIVVWREQGRTKEALAEAELQGERARDREADARAEAARAEANFRKALDGVNRLLYELENPRWAGIPRLAELRQEFNEQGLRFFQEFIDQNTTDAALRFQTVRAYERMANVFLGMHQFPPAEAAHHKAVALLEGLLAEHPADITYRNRLANRHYVMGLWQYSLGRRPQASVEFSQAADTYRQGLASDTDGETRNSLAWLLCDCPQTDLRNPAQAVALAREAIALAPNEGSFWTTLALAQFRAGDSEAAIAAAEKGLALHGSEGDLTDWFLLAMARGRLGQRDRARSWYDKAVHWMDHHAVMTDRLVHLRIEAAALLGVDHGLAPPK
jgi:serine/threonine protein kinase